MGLPFPTREEGLYFYHLDPDFKADGGPILGHWSGELVDELKPPLDKSVPGIIRQPDTYFYLDPLSPLEREWLAHGVCEPFYEKITQALQTKDAVPVADTAKTDFPSVLSEELKALAVDVATGEKFSASLTSMRADSLEVVTAEYQRLVDTFLTTQYGTKGY